MRPVVLSPVPSKDLLRYLRAQSAGVRDIATSDALRHTKSRPRVGLDAISQRRFLHTSRAYHAAQYSSHDEPRSTQHEPLKALPPPRSYLYHQRHASSRVPRPPRKSGWASFWSRFRRSSDSASSQEECFGGSGSDDTSSQLFNLSRALARSPTASDLKLRCTEFDANGSVTIVSGEFKKSELIAKYGLQPRDLRKIDSSVLPHILVRPSAILLNLLHLRVLIQSDRVLVFDAFGSTDSYTQSLFMYDLEGKLRQKPDPRNTSTYLPYEFRALEAVLISVTSGLEAEFALVRDPVTHILQELEEDIDREKLRHLLIHSKKLGTFEQKARLVRDAIDDLLEADDDLSAMYLTERKTIGEPRSEDEHQEVEMLLEAYHKICDEIVEISGNLISNIRNTEEVVKAILDANRNQLMLLEIKFSIGTLGLAGGTLIAGLYGMNLNNFIEETDFGFGAVSAVSFVLSGVICVYGMRKLRKVQKVRMWGEGVDVLGRSGSRTSPLGGRGNWRNENMESHARNMRMLQDHLKMQQQAQAQNWTSQSRETNIWPTMEGLELHKLKASTATTKESNSGGQVDEETGYGYSSGSRDTRSTSRSRGSKADADARNAREDQEYQSRIHAELRNSEERLRQEQAAANAISARAGRTNSTKK